MRSKITPVLIVIVLLVQRAAAQQHPPDPLQGFVFPPELVMQHQQALGLTEDQKSYFRTETRQAQSRFMEIQWKLQDEMEKWVALVKQPRADEQQVLAQLEKVLAVERDIKRAQVSLLIRMKNKLTQEQQAMLREIQSKGGSK